MIQNNSLSDRLNDFKNDQLTPEEETNDNIENITPISSLINSFISIIVFFIRSFAFGYGLMTILNLNWSFLGYLSIGVAINFLIGSFLELIMIIRGD